MAPDAAIHASAGMRSRASGAVALAAPFARAGSCNHSSAGASNNAGAPATASAMRQPYACANGPVIAALSITPTGTAIMKPGAARGGHQVADPTVGGRRADRFANPHSQPRSRQKRIARRQAAQSGQPGPHGYPDGQQLPAAPH